MNELKVGLMALATMAAVVYMSFKVTSNQSGFGDYVPYRTIIQDASGIFPKTPIKVAGINAGRIKEIELKGNNALIIFELREEVQIPEDSVLRIKTVGFLGDKYLEIYIGKKDEFLQPMDFIESEEGGGVEALVKEASEVMKDVKAIVRSVRKSLAPKEGEPPLDKIIANIEELAKNTRDVSASLKRVISGNEGKLNRIVDNMEKFSREISYHVTKENKDSVVSDVKRVLANAEAMTRDLKEIVADVKQGKGTLGKIVVEEEIADEVKQTLASVKKIVSKVDSIRTELSMYTGYNTDYGGETELGLKIFPSPERFYLLGVTTTEFGPEDETLTTTIRNGNRVDEIRREKEKDTYVFNVQLGRKIHNWSLRGGVIESSGGFGIDYDVPEWGTRFTTEFFDYREDIGINWRVSSQVQVWNVLYGKVAVEDILEDTSATISAGLRFNDEDLKGLIGFFL